MAEMSARTQDCAGHMPMERFESNAGGPCVLDQEKEKKKGVKGPQEA